MQEKLSRAQSQLLGGAVCAMVVAAFGPHLAQHADYHAFADQREALGVPSALNVLSNLPFLFGGLWGLRQVVRQAAARTLDTRWWLAALFFSGLVTTAVGSGVYHWAPTDFGLTIDRMGMVVAFAGLAAMATADRISERSALWVAGWFAIFGALWAWWWLRTSNFLPWAVLQVGGVFLIGLLAARHPTPGAWGVPLAKVAGLYVVAKLVELADHTVMDLTRGLVSGHTLKHLVAAAVVLPVLQALPKPDALRRNVVTPVCRTSV